MHEGGSFFRQAEVTTHHVRKKFPFFSRAGPIALACLGGIFFAPSADSDTATLSQTLNLQLAAIGKLSVPASITLTSTGTVFNTYTGSLTLSYRARSTPAGGGTITVQSTGEFSPAGGPTVSSGTFTYACSAATLGTPYSGPLTLSLVSQTNVLTIPPGACTGGGAPCSAADPNSVVVNFSLANDPAYETGSYTAVLTFTISSV